MARSVRLVAPEAGRCNNHTEAPSVRPSFSMSERCADASECRRLRWRYLTSHHIRSVHFTSTHALTSLNSTRYMKPVKVKHFAAVFSSCSKSGGFVALVCARSPFAPLSQTNADSLAAVRFGWGFLFLVDVSHTWLLAWFDR